MSDFDLLARRAELEALEDPADLAAALAVVEAALRWEPLDYQRPPPGDWKVWLLNAGRGTGKTDACAFAFDEHMTGPPCLPDHPGGHRAGIIAPTLGDASDACVNGPSGLKAHNPQVVERTIKGGTVVRWPNGAQARLFGAYTPDDVNRLRAGGNRCFDWYEEFAAWRQLEEAWTQAVLGLRLGPQPRAIASTTPKPRMLIKALLRIAGKTRGDGSEYDLTDASDTVRKLVETARPGQYVVTVASTRDNPYLRADVRASYYDQYDGTRIGRQELEGEVVEEVEGALWAADLIESHRVLPGDAPTMRRMVVAVDPSWGTTNDECGIVVAGVGWDGRGYVLDDLSVRATPSDWGAVVRDAYRSWKADRIVAEVNFQAEQVRLVMKTVDPLLSFKEVRASRGKQQRAEPISALYEQGKVSHVGRFGLLERQMTEWVPGESEFSPDRVDALVWALTELMVDGASGPADLLVSRRRLAKPNPLGARSGRRLGAVR